MEVKNEIPQIQLPVEGMFYTLRTLPKVERDTERCYAIINKQTEVIEAETQLLPQAFQYLRDLDKAMAAEMALREAVQIEDTLASIDMSGTKPN